VAEPSSQSPTLLWDVARLILDAAKDGLAAAGLSAPDRSIVVAGSNPAWDDCCPGQMTVHLARAFLTDDFPNETRQVRAVGCGEATLGADYLVQVVACAPSSGARGAAPAAELLDAHAQETLLRSYAVLRGLMCWAGTYGAGDPWGGPALVRNLEPIGETGGCVGYLIRVSVALEPICPCAPLEELGEVALLPGVVL
jgi:hypothetical protein